MIFGRKRRGLEELGAAIKPVIAGGDLREIRGLLDDLGAYCEDDPGRVEAYMGLAILVCMDSGWIDITESIDFFLEKWPHSISPVRVGYAGLLAGMNGQDMATHLCRDYLFDLRQTGAFEKISELEIARKGAGRAFLVMTSAYTKLGARSYSKRVLDYAVGHGAFGEIMESYRTERETIESELQKPKNAKLDAVWEEFFKSGRYGDKLIKWCDKNGCPKMAQRVDLIWCGFRYDRHYKVDASEILKHVKRVEVEEEDGSVSEALALV